nr:reverse transcriptase domain-containing protein [Tanacetum cinerariifolium]
SSGGVIDLTNDEDPTDEDGDTEMNDSTGVSASLGGEISLGGKKYRESNSNNTVGIIAVVLTTSHPLLSLWPATPQRYQELALLYGRMFFEESDKIEKYIGGLPDMIHGSVVASKPKTMQEAIEIATELMDKKIRTFAERETASKR